jgi:hypothetical protein
MKFRTLIFGLIAFSFMATLFAEEQPRSFGAGNYGKETLEAIQGIGLVKLNGTSITNTVDLIGSLITQNAEIGTLRISGEANLSGTTVHNGGTIEGSVQLVHTTVLKPLSILCQKVVFTASKLDAVTIRQDLGFKGKQILELKQGTLINGPVHFESGKGEIILFPGCKILGPITGAKVVKKS